MSASQKYYELSSTTRLNKLIAWVIPSDYD